jgi:hypothetical protein
MRSLKIYVRSNYLYVKDDSNKVLFRRGKAFIEAIKPVNPGTAFFLLSRDTRSEFPFDFAEARKHDGSPWALQQDFEDWLDENTAVLPVVQSVPVSSPGSTPTQTQLNVVKTTPPVSPNIQDPITVGASFCIGALVRFKEDGCKLYHQSSNTTTNANGIIYNKGEIFTMDTPSPVTYTIRISHGPTGIPIEIVFQHLI